MEKIKQMDKYCDSIKAKRDEYKKAWEMTEKKLKKHKTTKENEVIEF